jgi:hypothetical protein
MERAAFVQPPLSTDVLQYFSAIFLDLQPALRGHEREIGSM